MKFLEELFKVAEEKYQCDNDKDFKRIKIKYDYFTILIGEIEKRELYVKIKRGNNCVECLFNFKTLQEMFNENVNNILDFIIYRTIEYYYAERCKNCYRKENIKWDID